MDWIDRALELAEKWSEADSRHPVRHIFSNKPDTVCLLFGGPYFCPEDPDHLVRIARVPIGYPLCYARLPDEFMDNPDRDREIINEWYARYRLMMTRSRSSSDRAAGIPREDDAT
jgi:hypothetical protein